MKDLVELQQKRICKRLEDFEARTVFRRDEWKRTEGGGGITSIIEGGDVFEKGGVNTSAVHGELPEDAARALSVEPGAFFATGLSLVLHPHSPHVPSVHANFRYFALGHDLSDPDDEWFGGGADLTPYYPVLEDVRHFHTVWKKVCDMHSSVADYEDFKRRCDEYFYLPHREEARGVGGIFFDYLRGDAEALFAFVEEGAAHFLDAYVPIVQRRKDATFGAAEQEFQEIRRGRYVEFNLLYDRGTQFGLNTGGRSESILMSLPPRVRWPYNWRPDHDTPESRALDFFKPQRWV